ncbi:MAG: hypothetical protein ACIAQZ_01560 [Sedimentisphaeraceae bacterium JB056]
MAEKTYTLEQAAAKLGKTPEEFKEFAKLNNISELREGTNILYDAKDVDTAATSQSDDTVLNIEDSVIGLSDESSLLGLAPLDDAGEDEDEFEIDADMSSMVELTEADTRSGLTGLTDDAEEGDEGEDSILSLADSMSTGGPEESEAKIDADADIGSPGDEGSGSGLLDLSLQADDSQFGAVLDDILLGGDGDGGFDDLSDSVPSSGEDFADKGQDSDDYLADSGYESTPKEEEPEASEPEPVAFSMPSTPAAAAPQPAFAQPAEVDSTSGAFGVMMLLPFLAIVFAAIVLVAGFNYITPSIVNPIEDYILYVFGGLAVVAVLIGVIGAAIGGGSGDKAPKAPKAPKAKKVKAPKKKKKK